MRRGEGVRGWVARVIGRLYFCFVVRTLVRRVLASHAPNAPKHNPRQCYSVLLLVFSYSKYELNAPETPQTVPLHSRLKRWIMIGDHHQLPPVIKNMAFQKYSNMEQSLFTRFVRLGVPTVQLDAQGRARSRWVRWTMVIVLGHTSCPKSDSSISDAFRRVVSKCNRHFPRSCLF